MEDNQRGSLGARIWGALRTIWSLLRIIIPVTFAVALLDWLGVLVWFSRLLSPIMGLVGLPGDAALVFISSIFLNIYTAVAIALSMPLDLRSMTILAIMCLTAHNLIVETAVMKKTGSSGAKMAALRVFSAFAAAYAFNLLLPPSMSSVPFSSSSSSVRPDFLGMILAWALSTGLFALKIIAIVISVMIVQCLLEEFQVMDFLSRPFAPIMRLFGLPGKVSFLWIVINIVGYAYGADIVEGQIKDGKIKNQEADLFNHHVGFCHSLFKETILFLAVGIPLLWITAPRLVMAFLAVWIERGRRRFLRRSFRVGTD
jgi:hypothetical protein